ncbi:MAG: hypothetical protein ACRD3T_07310 [Terriglobia bacterium]
MERYDSFKKSADGSINWIYAQESLNEVIRKMEDAMRGVFSAGFLRR